MPRHFKKTTCYFGKRLVNYISENPKVPRCFCNLLKKSKSASNLEQLSTRLWKLHHLLIWSRGAPLLPEVGQLPSAQNDPSILEREDWLLQSISAWSIFLVGQTDEGHCLLGSFLYLGNTGSPIFNFTAIVPHCLHKTYQNSLHPADAGRKLASHWQLKVHPGPSSARP